MNTNTLDLDLLNTDLFDQSLDIDGEQLVDINMDRINTSAQDDATSIIANLSKFYYNEEFLAQNPNFKKRIDADMESLRILLKMRKADEEAHDILIKAIEGNSGNASLYKSLSEIQRTIISITSKMNDIIEGLNNMMKNYQLELKFDDKIEETEENTTNNNSYISKGSKAFIEQMNNKLD